ncbi:MAG: carboxypeptidase regulatory-like domain-containing protein [Chitinophagaceae bacterium]|nr:carboxypeptidase regulatory-like domain-containing protein [Chitinophagaceae bacterium]
MSMRSQDILFRISLAVCLLLAGTTLYAQQEIGVSVQVGRMPDGRYPTKIYQFRDNPGLVTLTLVNHEQVPHSVYLTGKLTGDNGVTVMTGKNYQPPTTIDLKPFETRRLNAIESSYLFDANNLVYLSGSASIKPSVFGEQGLPEGTYQLCVRAVDAATRKPLSEEDPLGCSNIFTVALLEPPMILNPYDEQDITPMAVQSIPIRWTTPAGAPPSTEYLVRIVEIFQKRNPYDAILSASTPFFETTVRGTPLFLYSIQHPRLQEGRTYAMMVVASDPLGGGTFRNNGRSEVVQFTYGAPGVSDPGAQQGQGQGSGGKVEYATHTLKGRLLGTFKKSEQGSLAITSRTGVSFAVTQAPIPSTYVSALSSSSAFAVQKTVTPLIKMNVLAAMNTDPTLRRTTSAVSNLAGRVADRVITLPPPPLPTDIVSGSGNPATECTYQSVTPDSATDRFPIPGLSVTLTGAFASGNQHSTLLATGKTDADGNYTLQFLDPAFDASNGLLSLTLSVSTTDFENPSFSLPVSVLTATNNDIGSRTLLARTIRFFPKAIFDDQAADKEKSYGVHIYRRADDIQARPWLVNEGQTGTAKKSMVMIDGIQMMEIATDTIIATAPDKSFLTISKTEAVGAGRVFLGGNLYVRLIPASASFWDLRSSVSVLNVPLPADKILQAQLTYKLVQKPSHIEGKVSLPLGEKGGTLPVQGATVRVMYVIKQRVPGTLDPNAFVGVKNLATNIPQLSAGGAPLSASGGGGGLGSKSLLNLVSNLAGQSAAKPVVLEAKNNNVIAVQRLTDLLSPEPEVSAVPDGYRAITTTTDELGKYYVTLPAMVDNADIIVDVINTPAEFRKFSVLYTDGNKQASFKLAKGASKFVDFSVKADVADVVGRVVDALGKPLGGAVISVRGNTITRTGPDGLFQFSIFPGTHTVTLEKEGFVVKDITINVPQLTNNKDNTYQSKWLVLTTMQKSQMTLSRVSQSQTVLASVARGNKFSAEMFGLAPANKPQGALAATTFNASLAAAFGLSTPSPSSQYETPREFAVDLKDVGYLDKIVGKARFRVIDESTGKGIPDTRITVFDSTNKTDVNGEWYYEGFGGATVVTLVPPAGSGCAADQRSMTLTETGKEQVITISLKKGVKVTGKVLSGSSALAGARIMLDDQEFTAVVSDITGSYTMLAPAGKHTISASKTNYVGQQYPDKTLPADGPVDFNLKGGNGKNYGKLLGFEIELSDATPVGSAQEKWSGRFVNLRPADGNISLTAETSIPFSGLIVSFDAGGNALPKDNKVATDMTELPLKLMGYLPLRLTGDDVLTFTGAGGTGKLAGKMKLDAAAIQGYRGWTLDNTSTLWLAAAGGTTAGPLTLFSSAGAQQTAEGYNLVTESAAVNAHVYGFAVQLGKAVAVDKDGLQCSGSIGTPALGPIQSLSIGIDKLAINRALSVSAVLLKQDNIPDLGIGSWKAAIRALVFNEDGFTLGGALALNIPGSDVSQVSFTDLAMTKDGVFGGSFLIPDGGINIMSLASLSTDGVPLSFGRVGNSNVYRIGGRASFKVNVPILDKPFKIPSFEVLTNGDFSLQTPVNYSTTVGPFGFAVSNLYLNMKDNTPYIGIQGEFKADLSILKFEIGDIKVKRSAGGPVFTVDKLGVKLDVPVLQASALVEFKDNGFAGAGSVGITGTPINASIDFHYFNRNGVTDLGANFFTNLPPIPIGVLVTLDGIGGGFNYISGGPNGGFAVDIRGKLSFLGTGPLVALDPVGITVSSAGILKGYGDVVIGGYLKAAHAEAVFNGPERTFTVQVHSDMSPLEGLAQQSIDGALIISAKKDDEFAFLGCAIQVKLLGLIDNHGEMAIGIRVKDPKTRGGLVSQYFQYAPDEYMQQRFSGVYINTATHVGIPRDNPVGFDLYIASAKIWAETGFQASLLLNLEEGAFRIKFGGKFDAGAEACVAKIACISVNAGLCYLVEGGRSPSLGWNFGATATGRFELGAGLGAGDCDAGCNEIVTVWDGCFGGAFKICGNASLDFSFSQRDGLNFKARTGGDTTPCF